MPRGIKFKFKGGGVDKRKASIARGFDDSESNSVKA